MKIERERERARKHADKSQRWDLKVNNGGRRRPDSRWVESGNLNGIATTFFFYNFPEDSTKKDLWKIFFKLGYIVDVFIAKKRNLAGKRFEFARFLGVHDAAKLGADLNDVWLGGFRLRSNLARFDRCRKSHKTQKSHIQGEKAPNGVMNMDNKITRRSFVDVVKGGTNRKTKETCLASSKERGGKNSLEGVLIGECRNFDFMKNLVKNFEEEGWGDLKLCFIGGLWVCIPFQSKDEAFRFLEDNKDVWICWFNSLGVWVPIVNQAKGWRSSRWGSVVDKWEVQDGNATCRIWIILTEKQSWIQGRRKVVLEGVETTVSVIEDTTLSLNLLLELSHMHVEGSSDYQGSVFSSEEDVTESPSKFSSDDDRSENLASPEMMLGRPAGFSRIARLPQKTLEIQEKATATGESLEKNKMRLESLEAKEAYLNCGLGVGPTSDFGSEKPSPVSDVDKQMMNGPCVVGLNNYKGDGDLVTEGSFSDSIPRNGGSSQINGDGVTNVEGDLTKSKPLRSVIKQRRISSPCSCRKGRGRPRFCAQRSSAGMVVGDVLLEDLREVPSSESDPLIQVSNSRNWAEFLGSGEAFNGENSPNKANSVSSSDLGRNIGFETRSVSRWSESNSRLMSNFLSINLNGLGERLKRVWVSELISKYRVSVLFLQETHVTSLDESVLRDFWRSENRDHCEAGSNGRSEGICTVWDTSFFSKEKSFLNSRFVAVLGCWLPFGVRVGFVNIYAPNSSNDRAALWIELLNLFKSTPGYCWVMGGDFNEVRRSEERKGSIFHSNNEKTFNDFISKAGLLEPPMGGRRFTWANADGTKSSKLDIFLFCSSFANNEDLVDLVRANWNAPLEGGNPHSHVQKLAWKLKRLKRDIKSWRLLVSKEKDVEKKKLTDKLDDLDSLLETNGWSNSVFNERGLTTDKLRSIDSLNLEHIRQKTKCKWIRGGDENTKYFHCLANSKKGKICFTGCLLTEVEKYDLIENVQRKAIHFSGNFKKISEAQNDFLEKSFSSNEIKEAVWGCGGEKSPGPDRFSFTFIKKFWDVVGPDFIDATNHFAKNPYLNRGCNDSFIALIPKTKDPLSLGDYRPIHLIGCIGKVISKVLAERLKMVIDSVISPEQTAYVKGKSIVDGPLIVNEIISWAKRTKKKVFLLKIDFEKAFDNLNWYFLFNTLEQMGFGRKWTGWIKGLVTSARVSVLVNGSPTSQFNLEAVKEILCLLSFSSLLWKA
ncbi:LOW QUALITY PROTEIN: hypothetical protein OSB04_003758 [Centaurea solstitialis]|uniref:RRM domain-containing protein n=1 Tax=Centaurea solstitialis TaxID=347529 RepID=A0AA38UCK3_9ASTR|nr:LOW QUALITY PROTEIN: hypothetical protein OSB04_003758 [Centaurea solstitialis]